jgi:hypothetical protein
MSQIVSDGTFLFDGGQDAYRTPDRIPENSYEKGVNVTTRKGVLGPRPGMWQIPLVFEDARVRNRLGYLRTIKNLFETGKYQAAAPYVVGTDRRAIIVIGGYIFSFNQSLKSVRLLSETIRVNEYRARINTTTAGRYVVIHDSPDYPVIVDGDEVFRANPNNTIDGNPQPQVPVSTMSTFNNNRLFVADAGVSFTAGDPVGNPATPEAPITFTETLVPLQAFFQQVFSLGTENAGQPITAMGFIQQNDKSTGIGSLFVATENSFYYYRSDLPRSQWEDVDFGNVLLFNAGVAGPRAFANVNSDLIFLSGEGYLHALSTSRNDSQRWGNTPISREVQNYLKFGESDLRQLAFVGYHSNRVFAGANPYRVRALDSNERLTFDYVHGGMVVLLMDNLSSLRVEAPPSWDGLYTGVDATDFVTLGDTGYVLGKVNGINGLFEVMPDKPYDIINGVTRPIRSYIYTREYQFKSPLEDKSINSVMFPLHNVRGNLTVSIDYKPSHGNYFSCMGVVQREVPYRVCDFDKCGPTGLLSQQFKQLIVGEPANDVSDPATQDQYATSKGFQLRIGIEALDWQLRAIGVKATMEADPHLDNTQEDYVPTKQPEICEPDWLVPELSLCP